MSRQAFATVDTRDRLLRAFVARLACAPGADRFALRGGMLVDHLVPGVARVVSDVDLVCRAPFDLETMRGHLGQVLAGQLDDGVELDAGRFRVDPVWPDSPHPGLRLFAAGRVDGRVAEITVDLTFDLEIWPRPSAVALDGGVPLWTCPPEMVIGTKLRVIGELGRRHWRPKDLADILLLLRRGSRSTAVLGEALERALAQGLDPGGFDLGELFTRPSWWTERSAARWSQFTRRNPLGQPPTLAAAVGELRHRLSPIWSRR